MGLYPLISVVDIHAGYTFREKLRADSEGGVRVVQMRDVSQGKPPDWASLARAEAPGKRSASLLKAGDVILVMRGGNYLAVPLASVPQPAVATAHFFILRAKGTPRLRPEFLAWQLNYGPAQAYFSKIKVGSTQLSLRQADLGNMPIFVLPLPEQEKIVAVATCHTRQQAVLKEILVYNDKRQQALALALHRHSEETND